MNSMEDIRKRIQELRWKLMLNRSQFAAQMGVKQNTWANIEKGVNPCSDRWVNLVCLTFGVRKEWFLNGKGDMFEPDPPKITSIEPVANTSGASFPPELAELISIYQELVPLNQKAVLDFLETTLQSQRNTVKALEKEKAPD